MIFVTKQNSIREEVPYPHRLLHLQRQHCHLHRCQLRHLRAAGNWHETYNHAYPSGNTAQADITMVRKVLFITVQTETAHLVLTCDAKGNLS